MSHVPYYNGITPIALVNENLAIPIGGSNVLYAKIIYIEPIQPFAITQAVPAASIASSGAVTPGTVTIGSQNMGVTQLQLENDDEKPGGLVDVGQYRIKASDFVYLQINYPQTSPKFALKNFNTYITPFTKSKDTEFFVYGYRNMPYFTLYNYSPSQILAKLTVYGLKYKTQILAQKPTTYTVVPTISSIAVSALN